MLRVVSWNVRGLNNSIHQQEVLKLINDGSCSIIGILESHLKKKKLDQIGSKVFGRWEWTSNSSDCPGATRIIIGWNPSDVNIMVLNFDAQVIHCLVKPINATKEFYLSIVYAHNRTSGRRPLWQALYHHKTLVCNNPWVIMGDFNATIDPSDKW